MKRKGFTLTELLIVVAIVGIAAAMIVSSSLKYPPAVKKIEQGKTLTESDFKNLEKSLSLYRLISERPEIKESSSDILSSISVPPKNIRTEKEVLPEIFEAENITLAPPKNILIIAYCLSPEKKEKTRAVFYLEKEEDYSVSIKKDGLKELKIKKCLLPDGTIAKDGKPICCNYIFVKKLNE